MGIPSYFKSLVNEFPLILKSKSIYESKNNRVFLDFNCGIHHVSSKLKANKIYKNNEEFENDLINEVIKYLDLIFEFTNPIELFYISIDGVPSRSKIIQQRQRRFNGMCKKNQILEIANNINNKEFYEKIKNEWSSDNISPGTLFMNKLSGVIKKHINKYPVSCILSDSLEPGEGEYKIFKYIKENTSIDNNIIDIIYGLDADLIMLSLINNKSKIYLLREPMFYDTYNTKEKFIYFDIKLLSEKLIETLNNKYEISAIDTNLIIFEYVFICIFLGNDFIPSLSYIKISNDGINTILKQYSKIRAKCTKNEYILYFKNNKWNINYNILFNFIKLLSTDEDKLFLEYDNNYYSFVCRDLMYNANKDINKYIDSIINSNIKKYKNVIRPDLPKWRQRYYYYMFDDNNGNLISDICTNYVEAIQWIVDYYFNQTYHNTWYYRYSYSPTIVDLANYLQVLLIDPNISKKKTIYNNILYPNINISTDMQLLMILPISSLNLHKDNYKKIITNITEGFTHYYPLNTSFYTYLKKFSWEFIPKLPEFDILELYQYTEKIIQN
jgi:5'-3' exonuclease